jgi:hypothetical protein
MKRYLTRERVLTPEERQRIHDAAIEEAREEYAAASENLKAAIAAEPPKTETEYVEVKPGEPGYDDASCKYPSGLGST